MTRAVWVVALALGAAVPSLAKDEQKIVPKSVAELEQQIRTVLKDTKTPGAGVALVSRDQVLWAAGLGKADVASGKDATAETLFRIGSISKAFVSLSILMLQEEGKLSLDDVARQRVPEVWFQNQWEASHPIRIVHLLEHTTGFDDLRLREYALNAPEISVEGALAYHPASRVSRWRPGTRFSYCNSGPPIAARIVETLTGQRFEEFVAQRLFRPLRMDTASYFLTEAVKGQIATLYYPDGLTPYSYWHIGMRPSGSVNASPAEMANFARLLLNRGSFEGTALLQPASIDRMERPATTWAAQAGVIAGYGLGNYTSLDNGFAFHGHDGGVEGGLSSLGYLPNEGVGYFFSINSGSGQAFERIEELIKNYLTRELAKPAHPPAAKLAPETARIYSGYYRPDSPRQEIGRSLERILGVVRIRISEVRLTLTPLFGETRDYVPVSGRQLRKKDQAVASLVLVDDPAEGRFVQEMHATFRPASVAGVWLERLVAAVALLGMASAPLFALIWVPRRLFGRMRGVRHLRVRVVSLLSVLCLVAAVVLFIVSDDDLIQRFGNATVWSVGFWVLGWAFALSAVSGLLLALRVPAAETNRWARRHALAVSLANTSVALYLLYWGIVGLRTWA